MVRELELEMLYKCLSRTLVVHGCLNRMETLYIDNSLLKKEFPCLVAAKSVSLAKLHLDWKLAVVTYDFVTLSLPAVC